MCAVPHQCRECAASARREATDVPSTLSMDRGERPGFLDGILAGGMDTAAIFGTGASVMHRPGTDPASPRVLRVECMPLDRGGAAVVVELDRTPERAWMKSLKRAFHSDEMLDGVQVKFDGRFVYVVGVEVGLHRAQHRVMRCLLGLETVASTVCSQPRMAGSSSFAIDPGRGRMQRPAAVDVQRVDAAASREGRDLPMDGLCA